MNDPTVNCAMSKIGDAINLLLSDKYQVFDNGKPADYFHCNVHESWDQSKYFTFEEAKNYAMRWLGAYSNAIEFEWDGSPIDYNGMGDMIEIRKVN